MEILWAALGGIGGAGFLVWSIFSFFIDRRDKTQSHERHQFYKDLYNFEDRLDSEIKTLRFSVEKVSTEMQLLRLSNEKLTERLTALHEKFHDYAVRVDRVLERQETKIDQLGKIIKIGE